MSSRRIARVEQLLKEELSMILQQELKDPRIGFVTVTRVKVSADLGHARAYVSVMGDAEAKERTISGLRSAVGFIQRLMGSRIKMRSVPRVEFFLDDSVDYGFRINEILDKIEAEKKNE
ncbi:MAG: 30S ribosome-binding factor RbfA [bacterium]